MQKIMLFSYNFRLEEEETSRQKLQLEKVSADSKIKKLEEDLAIQDDSNQKLTKDKRFLDERVSELQTQLVEEEEKSKQMTKLKNKYEQIIKDLEEKLRKEQQVCDLYCIKKNIFGESCMWFTKLLSQKFWHVFRKLFIMHWDKK